MNYRVVAADNLLERKDKPSIKVPSVTCFGLVTCRGKVWHLETRCVVVSKAEVKVRVKVIVIVAGQEKGDSGECIRHASVTPRNMEYTKYDPPGMRNSDDALAQKYLLYTPPARLKSKI